MCSLGSTLSTVWNAVQNAVFVLAAVGAVAAAAVSVVPSGRRWLKRTADEFSTSPEGAQALQLIGYLCLMLAARVFETLTGVRGVLSALYIGSAAMALSRLLCKIPSPAEARAMVVALEEKQVREKAAQREAQG